MKEGYEAEALNDQYLFPLAIFIICYILSVVIIFHSPDMQPGEGDLTLFFSMMSYLLLFIIYLISLSIAGSGISLLYKNIKKGCKEMNAS
jgi:hypothetical protein